LWEDRYHATAIEAGEHLLRCLVYVDLNMVRSGVVSHPEQWLHGGYNEIQRPWRKNILKVGGFELQESQSPYKAFFDTEKNDIECENLWFWNE
jgi:hypothetical protein